jgi:hypothetical protein
MSRMVTVAGPRSASASAVRACRRPCTGAARRHVSCMTSVCGRREDAGPRATPVVQGLFLLATGIWPLLHLRSFEAVTGPKVDDWLVKTMGALLAVTGGSLIVGELEGSRSRAVAALGIGSAAALGAADIVYVTRRRISPIYLADAVAQLGIIGAWLAEARPLLEWGSDSQEHPRRGCAQRKGASSKVTAG